MRLITVAGARPQFVKAAVVSRALAQAGIEEILVHTGQHHDARLSGVFFRELGLPEPHRSLGISGLPHGAMTGRMLERIEETVEQERPDGVLVYGDTNSTLAGALAAAKLAVPVAHVEAGLRSFDRRMPEEVNRVVTDHLATWHFCTGEGARRRLAEEGIREGVHVVGDVMADAVRIFADAARRSGARRALGLEESPYGVATVHRAGNTGDPDRLRGIAEGLRAVARYLPLVLPLHPRTRAALERAGIEPAAEGLRVVEPLGYLALQDVLAGAALVLTDSGGLQKEAFLRGVPCVTLRDVTEWTETLEPGRNCLAGADPDRIEGAARAALAAPPTGPVPAVFGDGRAGERIAGLLAGLLAGSVEPPQSGDGEREG